MAFPDPAARSCELLVLGAGPTGLATAHFHGGNTVVLEAENRVGGLCRSLEFGGAVFDIGGHSFHTPHTSIHQFVVDLMAGDLEFQTRDARIVSHGRMIPYPFQKHFQHLPDPEAVRECREGLALAHHAPRAENFEDWIVQRFGPGIARHFLWPYNRKLWARDLRTMSTEWVGQRVAAPRGEEERFVRDDGPRRPLQSDTEVGYPSSGGFETLFQRLAAVTPGIELNKRVERIDPVARIAWTSDGTAYHWHRLVSTIPLDQLVERVDGFPSSLREGVQSLAYMSLNLLLLRTNIALPEAPQRIYFADPSVPPHKVAFNHTSSRHLRRRPCHAITAEISYSPTKPKLPPEVAERDTVSALVGAGVLPSAEVVAEVRHLDIHHAYPVYTHERPAILERVRRHLASFNIHIAGRFGEWEYVNSDECLRMGRDLGLRLRSHKPR